MRPTRMAFLPLVAIAAILASCSNSESGTPEASGGPSNPASSSAATSTPTDEGAGTTPLSGLDPCSLLSTSDAAQFGPVEEPKREQIGTADTCAWSPDRSDGSIARGTVSIGTRENAGVQDVADKGMGVQRTEENGRDYARSPNVNGCTIAIGVTDSARVDVVVSGADPGKACEMANTITELVEPKVPQG